MTIFWGFAWARLKNFLWCSSLAFMVSSFFIKFITQILHTEHVYTRIMMIALNVYLQNPIQDLRRFLDPIILFVLAATLPVLPLVWQKIYPFVRMVNRQAICRYNRYNIIIIKFNVKSRVNDGWESPELI
jgi:hypothetical protein